MVEKRADQNPRPLTLIQVSVMAQTYSQIATEKIIKNLNDKGADVSYNGCTGCFDDDLGDGYGAAMDWSSNGKFACIEYISANYVDDENDVEIEFSEAELAEIKEAIVNLSAENMADERDAKAEAETYRYLMFN